MSVNKYINGKLLQLSGNADTRLTTDDIINILEYTPASSDGSNATGEWDIDITGNAETATKLQTSRTLMIGDTGKSFNGSSDVSWTLSEIGAAPATHTHNYAGSSSAGGAATTALECTGNSATATNADQLDNRHASQFVYNNQYTIDLTDTTVYDENTWYHVTGTPIPNYGRYFIKVTAPLAASKPSWGTHNSGGFTCNMELYVKASGWGATNGSEICMDHTCNYTKDGVNPLGYKQMTNASVPVLFLRGGGKYFVYTDFDVSWTARTSTYTANSQSVSPVTTAPGVTLCGPGTIKANLDGKATKDGNGNVITERYLPHITITDPTDFNNLSASGVYHIATTSISNNQPISNNGTLISDNTVGTPYQIFIPDNIVSYDYKRYYNKSSSTWNSWTKRAFPEHTNYVPLQTGQKSLSTAGWYRIAKTDSLKTHGSFILSIDRDYNNYNSESHTFAINYAFQTFSISELNSCINGRGITDVRIVWNSHTSSAYLEIYYYLNNTNTVRYTISSRMGNDCGWDFITPEAGSCPEGYNAYSFETNHGNGALFNRLEMSGNLEFTDSGKSFRGIAGKCSANDWWRVGGAGTSDDNAGYMELATCDDASEPIYVRQYSGAFATLKRTLTLLDGSGNTELPGSLYMSGKPAFTQETGSQTAYQSANQSDTATNAFGIGTNSTMYNSSTILRGYYIYLNPYYRVSSSATIGIASDEKVKTFSDDIQTDEDKLVKLFDLIKPKSYNYNYSHPDNLNIGFSAQDIEKAMIELDIDPEKYGILNIRYNHMLSRGDSLEDSKFYTKFYEISYNDLFSLSLLKMNVMEKQHVARLESLEERLTALENK